MQTRLTTILFLLIFPLAGCRQSAEDRQRAAIDKFNRQMVHIDASISLGMTRSNVFSLIGHPKYTVPNCGPASNWVADDYIFDPHIFGGYSTDGITIVYSNEAVIRKSPILCSQ